MLASNGYDRCLWPVSHLVMTGPRRRPVLSAFLHGPPADMTSTTSAPVLKGHPHGRHLLSSRSAQSPTRYTCRCRRSRQVAAAAVGLRLGNQVTSKAVIPKPLLQLRSEVASTSAASFSVNVLVRHGGRLAPWATGPQLNYATRGSAGHTQATANHSSTMPQLERLGPVAEEKAPSPLPPGPAAAPTAVRHRQERRRQRRPCVLAGTGS